MHVHPDAATLQHGKCGGQVYRATYRRVAERNRRFYKRYPGDVDKVCWEVFRWQGWQPGVRVRFRGAVEAGVPFGGGVFGAPRRLVFQVPNMSMSMSVGGNMNKDRNMDSNGRRYQRSRRRRRARLRRDTFAPPHDRRAHPHPSLINNIRNAGPFSSLSYVVKADNVARHPREVTRLHRFVIITLPSAGKRSRVKAAQTQRALF